MFFVYLFLLGFFDQRGQLVEIEEWQGEGEGDVSDEIRAVV